MSQNSRLRCILRHFLCSAKIRVQGLLSSIQSSTGIFSHRNDSNSSGIMRCSRPFSSRVHCFSTLLYQPLVQRAPLVIVDIQCTLNKVSLCLAPFATSQMRIQHPQQLVIASKSIVHDSASNADSNSATKVLSPARFRSDNSFQRSGISNQSTH